MAVTFAIIWIVPIFFISLHRLLTFGEKTCKLGADEVSHLKNYKELIFRLMYFQIMASHTSNIFLSILTVAFYIVLFFIKKYHKTLKADNRSLQPRAVYNNLCVELSNEDGESEFASNISQLKKTVKVITFVFLICWLPFFIYSFVFKGNDVMIVPIFLLACSKSVVSPYICVCVNPDFRNYATTCCR
jgi:phage-related protein